MPYIGNTIRAADDYRLIDDISSGFNGSATSFALQVAGSSPVPFPKSPQQILVSVNGVIQEPDPTGASGFNLVGTNIVFSSAPTNGHAFFGIIYATADYLNAGGEFPAGSVGAPSFTFIGDEDTGIYRKGSGSVGFVSNATEIANTDSNGITISSGNLNLGDSSGSSDDRIKLGASGDLELYHNGSDSFIVDQGTGVLVIQGSQTKIRNDSGHTQINANNDVVELYYDNSKKFETLSSGVKITGLNATGSSVLGDFRFKDQDDNLDVHYDAENNKIQFLDNNKATFGTGDDLQIYHDGSNSYIKDTGTGQLRLATNEFLITNAAVSENMLKIFENGAVELYYDASKKLETTTGGIDVDGTVTADDIITAGALLHEGDTDTLVHFTAANTIELKTGGTTRLTINNSGLTCNSLLNANGNRIILGDSSGSSDDRLVLGNSDDLEIYHDGSNSYIDNNTGNLNIVCDSNQAINLRHGSENMLRAITDGAAELYYDNSKKLETTSTGVSIPGILQMGTSSSYIDLPDNASLYCGTGDDLRIFHDGTNSIINNSTGNLQVIASNQFRGRAQGYVFNSYDDQEGIIKGFQNGAVELYYDGSKKFETTSGGATFLDNVRWNDNKAARFGGGDDLQIYHNGSHSIINNTTGSLQVHDSGTEKFRVSGSGTFFKDDITLSNDSDKLNLGAGNDLQIYHDGSHSYIDNSTGSLFVRGDTIKLRGKSADEDLIEAFVNGSVRLYYDNSTKLETTSGGIDVTGRVTTDDLTVQKASGNLSVMVTADSGLGTMEIGGSTGAFIDLKTPSSNDFDLRIGTSGTAGYILAAGTGIISIQGHPTPAANNTYDLGTTSLRWRNVYTNDLNLSNEGGANDVDGTWGNYTIQEGAEDLFLINRRNGKKFKFNLMEVA